MDRFEWSDFMLSSWEAHVTHQTGVALYDGNDKTSFENGTATLSTHRLLWRDAFRQSSVLSLPLSLVVFIEEQPSGFAKSAKIVVHLHQGLPGRPAGPSSSSPHNFIRLSFRESGEAEFFRFFQETLQQKRWEQPILPPSQPGASGARHRPGIVGIERSIQQKNKDTDKSISQSFQDLQKLMEKAQEMVSLSKTIVTKIRDKQGDITEDETVKFKSYLLSMGIPDPVTRETHGTGDKYYTELAKQLAAVLETPIKESGGMMTLTDVYCRVNRARGMELLSPEDLLNACEIFEFLKLPVRLRVFDSGVMVIQSKDHSEDKVIKSTAALASDLGPHGPLVWSDLQLAEVGQVFIIRGGGINFGVEEKSSLTAEELAQQIGLSVILAKERLLLTEKVGGVCRDDTVEGLRFFPNLFLTKTS